MAAVTRVDVDHPRAWTEADYLALGETISRIELIDGGLWVSPWPDIAHQAISYLLHAHLDPPAHLRKVRSASVRLAADRIVIADLAVGWMARLGRVADAAEVAMVAEVVSRGSRTVDRSVKTTLYAAAGIDWYLLAEPDLPGYGGLALRLLRRRDDRYVEAAAAGPGGTLVSDQPFPIEVHTDALLDF